MLFAINHTLVNQDLRPLHRVFRFGINMRPEWSNHKRTALSTSETLKTCWHLRSSHWITTTEGVKGLMFMTQGETLWTEVKWDETYAETHVNVRCKLTGVKPSTCDRIDQDGRWYQMLTELKIKSPDCLILFWQRFSVIMSLLARLTTTMPEDQANQSRSQRKSRRG